MNDRRFQGEVERLRSPDRLARLEVSRVVSLCLAPGEVQSVLDVGTGSGVFAEAFAHAGLRVGGVDIAEEMLVAARAFVPSAEFAHGAMEKLPYADRSFDLVFLGLVLHEADDLTEALREARRVATQRVVILEWPHETGEMGPPLDHRLTPLQIEKTALAVGFSYVEAHRLESLVVYRLG